MNEHELATLTTFRRELHRNPEVSCQERETAQRVAKMLKQIGVDEIHEGIGGYGLVAIIRGNAPGIGVALRADMDALPILEDSGKTYRSTNDDVMHACGHDGHTAMLMGAAMDLVKHRPTQGQVVLIVQPAEEVGTGAPGMIADGLFEKFPVEAIFGLHNWPGLGAGDFVVHDVPHMASSDDFEVEFYSEGGHGAMPHLTTDPIVATGLFITSLQQIVSRNVSPEDIAVISVGSMKSGNASNIIPSSSKVKGTSRCFTEEVRKILENRVHQVANGIALATGCNVTLNYFPSTPAVANAPECAALCRSVIEAKWGKDRLIDHPISMGADDMGFFLQEKPGAYCWIGNDNKPDSPKLHQPDYDFNDALLSPGSIFLASVARQFLDNNQ